MEIKKFKPFVLADCSGSNRSVRVAQMRRLPNWIRIALSSNDNLIRNRLALSRHGACNWKTAAALRFKVHLIFKFKKHTQFSRWIANWLRFQWNHFIKSFLSVQNFHSNTQIAFIWTVWLASFSTRLALSVSAISASRLAISLQFFSKKVFWSIQISICRRFTKTFWLIPSFQ